MRGVVRAPTDVSDYVRRRRPSARECLVVAGPRATSASNTLSPRPGTALETETPRALIERSPRACEVRSGALTHSPLPIFFFFFQAEDGIRDVAVTAVQTCALPI